MKDIYRYERKNNKSFLENCKVKLKKKDASYYRECFSNELIQEAVDCSKEDKE